MEPHVADVELFITKTAVGAADGYILEKLYGVALLVDALHDNLHRETAGAGTDGYNRCLGTHGNIINGTIAIARCGNIYTILLSLGQDGLALKLVPGYIHIA